MKFYLRFIFLVSLALLFKFIFDVPLLPPEVSSLQNALHNKYLINDNQTLIINMKKVFKTQWPQKVLEQLVNLGGNINAKSADGSTPLGFSVLFGNKELVKYLIISGVQTDELLLRFVLKRCNNAACLLIKCGANVNIQDPTGNDLLPFVIITANKQVQDHLAAHGIFEKAIDNSKADQDALKLVQLLLTKGANPNAQFNGQTALALSIMSNTEDITKLILNHEANPNIRLADKNGLTPLIVFVARTDTETVKAFLEKGADVNYTDNTGKTALFYVKDKALAELLIDKCADINFKDLDGNTALNWAAQQKNEELVRLLLSKGVDVTIKNNNGKSALDSVQIE